MRLPILCAIAGVIVLLASACAAQEPTSRTSGSLREYLRNHPDADADGDGLLTRNEMEGYRVAEALARFPEGTTHRGVMVPMRDGVGLATEVFRPAGEGRWPVILMRTPYGRWSATGYASRVKDHTVVFITQDVRGDGDSGGTVEKESFDNEIDDSADTAEWIQKQPWCNGRVIMIGGSGHGMAAVMAVWSNSPHITACHPGNSGGHAHLYWLYHNGVRRSMYGWLKNKGVPVSDWPRPTTTPCDPEEWHTFCRERVKDNSIWFSNNGGWYNIFTESQLDNFAALAGGGRCFMTIGPGAHGSMQGLKYPSASRPAGARMVGLGELIEGTAPADARSTLLYYLMGDVTDENAPGNVWKATHKWPVEHTPVSLYMKKDGGLDRLPPKDALASLTYSYDPKRPVPAIGGNTLTSDNTGPMDQRPLMDRKDILRFQSEPLAEPLAVTGKLWAELHVSSDVPDTTFMAKLIDVYPDGYQALVRDSAIMARYWQGPGNPAPLEKGKVYRLMMDMWSTAIVFNRGHRIAVHVTSSNEGHYEVHPNSYEPVNSMDDAPVASNTLHLSADHPSRLILPVVDLTEGDE